MNALLNPGGRTGRGGFWVAVIGLWILAVLVVVIPVVGPLLALALCWPLFVVHARRLRDMGRSAKWAIVPVAVGPICLAGIILTAGKALDDYARSEHGTNEALADAAWNGTLVSVGLGLVWVVVAFGFLLWLGIARPKAPTDPR